MKESKKMPAKSIKLSPLGDRVIIKPFSENDVKTKSGIIIPDTVSKEKSEQGEIMAVGPGKRDENGKIVPMNLKIGDKVMFSKYSGDEIKIDEVDYLVIKEENVLAIIR